jgi:hypothetical protein
MRKHEQQAAAAAVRGAPASIDNVTANRRPASSTCKGQGGNTTSTLLLLQPLLINHSSDQCSERHIYLAIWRKPAGTLPMDA